MWWQFRQSWDISIHSTCLSLLWTKASIFLSLLCDLHIFSTVSPSPPTTLPSKDCHYPIPQLETWKVRAIAKINSQQVGLWVGFALEVNGRTSWVPTMSLHFLPSSQFWEKNRHVFLCGISSWQVATSVNNRRRFSEVLPRADEEFWKIVFAKSTVNGVMLNWSIFIFVQWPQQKGIVFRLQ